MTEVKPPSRPRLRKTNLIAGLAVAAIAAFVGWLTVGDSGGCSAEAPAAFSRLYHVSSTSMEPALNQGDWLWAERRAYCGRDPERGDIAVLALAKHPGTVFIKRVIGVPGDRVQLQHGQLYLNGEPVRRDWVESSMHADETGDATQRARFAETLPNGRHYEVEVVDPEGPLENTGEITVPEGQYFVLGDDRDHSDDSRAADFGLVPRGAIADRPVRVLWSGNRSRIGLRLGEGG
jgi:signal peptidase I